jgi:hypothetical protein
VDALLAMAALKQQNANASTSFGHANSAAQRKSAAAAMLSGIWGVSDTLVNWKGLTALGTSKRQGQGEVADTRTVSLPGGNKQNCATETRTGCAGLGIGLQSDSTPVADIGVLQQGTLAPSRSPSAALGPKAEPSHQVLVELRQLADDVDGAMAAVQSAAESILQPAADAGAKW